MVPKSISLTFERNLASQCTYDTDMKNYEHNMASPRHQTPLADSYLLSLTELPTNFYDLY
jgi:hypothetical protein